MPAKLSDEDIERITSALSVTEKHENEMREVYDAVLILKQQYAVMNDLVAKHERTLYSNNGYEGVISQINHITRVVNTGQRIVGIVLGVILTSAVGAFIYLVVTHPLSIP